MDVVDVATDLGPQLLDLASPDQEGGVCRLRLEALPLIPQAADDAQRVADAVRYLAARYVAASGTPGPVSSADLERDLGWDDAETRRASLLLGSAGGMFLTWSTAGDGRLSGISLSSDVLAYQEVRTLEDFLAAVAAENERRRRKIASQIGGWSESTLSSAALVDASSSEEGGLPWEGLHPAVVAHAAGLFNGGHRNDAVRRAMVGFEERVRDRLESSNAATPAAPARSTDLMGRAFGGQPPALAVSRLRTESERNEQRGFMLLAQGAMAAIRNVLTHENRAEMSHAEALERLALASYLHRTLDAAEALQSGQLRPPEAVTEPS